MLCRTKKLALLEEKPALDYFMNDHMVDKRLGYLGLKL